VLGACARAAPRAARRYRRRGGGAGGHVGLAPPATPPPPPPPPPPPLPASVQRMHTHWFPYHLMFHALDPRTPVPHNSGNALRVGSQSPRLPCSRALPPPHPPQCSQGDVLYAGFRAIPALFEKTTDLHPLSTIALAYLALA